jgi:hypothetical protein
LHAKDRHHDTCLQSFQLQNDANFIARLHLKVQVMKNMSVELCVGNYATHDGICVDGIFQDQLMYSIHKKSFEYYLIILNVVNSQE